MAENTWPETHGRKSREREEEREEEKEVHGGGEQPEERREQAGDAWGLGAIHKGEGRRGGGQGAGRGRRVIHA